MNIESKFSQPLSEIDVNKKNAYNNYYYKYYVIHYDIIVFHTTKIYQLLGVLTKMF